MSSPLKPAASIDEVLDFCNKVREAGGGKPLNALLPGVPTDSQSCLIAKNLNFECEVGGLDGEPITDADAQKVEDSEDLWCMSLEDKEVRDRIAIALNLETIDARKRAEEDGQWIVSPDGEWATQNVYAVLLPKAIGNVAHNFDAAWDRYEQEFDDAVLRGYTTEEAEKIATKHLTRAMKKYEPYFNQKDAA